MVDLNLESVLTLEPLQAFTKSAVVNNMLNYFDKVDDFEQIKLAVKMRYGIGIASEPDSKNSESPTQMYIRTEFAEQVDNGQIEIVNIGFASKVSAALGTMFTKPSQKYTLVHSVEGTDTKAAEALLFEQNRKVGNYDTVIAEVDEKAVLVGSFGILVEFINSALSYQKVSPGDVYVHFEDYKLGKDDKERPVDRKKMEDATAIVIRIGAVSTTSWSYLAIFSRSKIYPQGRYVQFEAPLKIMSVPKEGSDGTRDYEINGKVGNPLSVWANDHLDEDIPEFPLVPILSGLTDSDSVFPIYESLYKSSVEFDVGKSHLESAGQKAAGGTRALERDDTAESHKLPPSLSGDISLMPGTRVVVVDHDAASIVAEKENIEDDMIHVASGYGVADFMVISKDRTLDASSGVALAVKMEPTKEKRDRRIKLNRPNVTKLFNVEKYYIAMHAAKEGNAKESDINLLLECTQDWDAGEIKLPQDQKVVSETVIALTKEGIYDTIQGIRVMYQCTSDQEAIEIYEKMKKRAKEFPPLKEEEQLKPALGLRPRKQPPGAQGSQ